MKRMKKSGFTLVEILIVVIILGILAAVIIPQFTDASTEAKTSSLTSNLQVLRSQIGLYKIQHNDDYPGDTDADGLADDADDFETDLTTASNEAGTQDVADGALDLGPYMPSVPQNPFSAADPDTNLIRIDGAAAGAGTHHWHFDSATGAVRADDGGQTADGTDHEDL